MNFDRIFAAVKSRWSNYRLNLLTFEKLGNNVKVKPGFRIGHAEHLEICDNVVLGENIFINAHGGVKIGSGTITGPDVMIFSVNHIYDADDALPFSEKLSLKSVVIGENCWLGARVFICPGVILGEGCVVAGGAVVSKSFPPYSVVGGAPARLLKYRDVALYLKAKERGVYNSFIVD